MANKDLFTFTYFIALLTFCPLITCKFICGYDSENHKFKILHLIDLIIDSLCS